MADLEIISPDETTEGADWTKTSWDLPPYKSPEFMAAFPDLEAFRKKPAYAAAVAAGLIMDDEWMGDHVQEHRE
jgi:hypothetical protein